MTRRPPPYRPPADPPAPVQREVVMSWEQVQNLARMSADQALQAYSQRVPTREEVEGLAQRVAEEAAERTAESAANKALEQFMLRVGIDEQDLVSTRKDFAWMRSAREISSAMGRHGLLVGVGLVVVALATAMWVGITKGMVK